MCIAHNLKNHNGKCRFIHGHNYKMLVTVSSRNENGNAPGSSSEGMIIDFKTLKNIVEEILVSKYDHSLILYKTEGGPTNFDEYNEIFENLSSEKAAEMNIHFVTWRPTAENMCIHFANDLKLALKDSCPSIELKKLRIYETDTSYAEVEFDE